MKIGGTGPINDWTAVRHGSSKVGWEEEGGEAVER